MKVVDVSPGVTPGGGLKRVGVPAGLGVTRVSPGVTPGGGLKPCGSGPRRQGGCGFPRGHTWGRIETPRLTPWRTAT